MLPPDMRAVLDRPVDQVRIRLEPAYVLVQAEPDLGLRVDAEGRWATARLGPWFLRRKVDGGIFVAQGPGEPRDLEPTSGWHEAPARLARRLLALLPAGAPEDAAQLLSEASLATPERWVVQAESFARAYPEPVPILPPDRYRDLVVLPATGCPYGRCAFCAWYRDARFQVLSPAAFEAHLVEVAALFGRAVSVRNGLFLGSASAFSVPDRVLLPQLDSALARFGPFDRGVAGFLDPDHAPARGPDEWRALATRGVRRVILGLESGHPPLRAELGKSVDLDPLVAAVRDLRRAGVPVGISVLAGAGSPRTDTAHQEDTVRLISDLPLGPEDLVYVSPLLGGGPPERLRRVGAQLTAALKAGIGAKVSPYRADTYRYFAW